MGLTDAETFYDVLDVSSASNSAEIREAYLRVKATFHRDSVALYSLISTEEREGLLQKIEEAFAVLSHPEKRREYDQSHGFLNSDAGVSMDSDNPFAAALPSLLDVGAAPVISIDRVPPMDGSVAEDQLLIPPSTDLDSALDTPPVPEAPGVNVTHGVRSPAMPKPAALPASSGPIPPPFLMTLDPALQRQIDSETVWPGSLLRKIRESQHISIEEMAGMTKVSKTYLLAVEDENFAKLPAPVYVRGFVAQLARGIKLPAPKVDAAVKAFMGRYLEHVQKNPK